MAYMHIENLYKNQTILLFKECYALEKIHGTSAHVAWKDGHVRFFAGGGSHEAFVKLFDADALGAAFITLGYPEVIIFGESYGGKQQGMSAVYGKEPKFVAFDVKIGDAWLNVPNAYAVATTLGFEFVPYARIPTTIEAIDAERAKDSEQAVRHGMGGGHPREGIVLRPVIECYTNNGERIIAKHKNDAFAERAHPPKVVDEGRLEQLAQIEAIVDEWVTPMRLTHVLQSLAMPNQIEQTGSVMKAMVEDVCREAAGEIVDNKDVRTAIGKRAAKLFKQHLEASIGVAQ